MIDWVSIVRHSRRRFSNYMTSVPRKVRKRRQKNANPLSINSGQCTLNSTSSSRGIEQHRPKSSCWNADKLKKKSRYNEDDVPPPASPPVQSKIINTTVLVDNHSRHGSLETVTTGRRKSFSEKSITSESAKQTYRFVYLPTTDS
ncbi:hypothetical protein HUJ05_000875 [Dendroctonus ponderosae]|nr:hypothetical protein HUJ05_000875 [Dendroctonus ponderosae]